MPETKRPLKVFLCHAHADRDPVRGLYTRLTKDGVDAWLDKAKLLPGQDWELEIRKAVREADVVVVCLSKQFNQAGFRQKEVRLALDTAMEKPEGEIFIIPARLEECDTLESLRRWHWVDLFEDDGYEMLMRALRARADKIGVALQISRAWLPNISSSHIKSQKTNAKKEQFTPKKKETASVNPEKKHAKVSHQSSFKMPVTVRPIYKKMRLMIGVIAGIIFIYFAVLWGSKYWRQISTIIPRIIEITDDYGVEMVLIPAGEFQMGSPWYDIFTSSYNEKPAHTVYLDAFYIDKYEVTNAHYNACVEDGFCTPPLESSSNTRLNYYGNSHFNNYPVVYVNWDQAKTYCEWHGAGLPTEAQWEKAARGIDGRTYPWGEGINCNKTNYYGQYGICIGDTAPVGSYESDKSPYGVYDMGGNVTEWVADWYAEDYYASSLNANPLGLATGERRVLRGGSFNTTGFAVRSAFRHNSAIDYTVFSFGFRCVREANP